MQNLIESFVGSLTRTLPSVLGMWAGGLVLYVVIGTVLAVVALRKTRSVSLKALWGQTFPRHLYADPTAKVTLWHFIAHVLVWAPLFALGTFAPTLAAGGVNALLDQLFGARSPAIQAGWLVVLVQTSVIVLSMSLASYLHHFAFHRIPVLWSFHRAHHSVEALTIPATVRDHPLDLFTIQLFMNACAALFGGLTLYATGTEIHHATFLIVGIGAAVYFIFSGIFNHSHIPISFGWFNRILMAPIIHQVHHSAELRHRDKNIGSFWGLMIWDWMFGTLYLPTKDEAYRWGLNEAELGPNNPHPRLRDLYIEPFQHAWKSLRKSGRGSGRQTPATDAVEAQ